MRFSPRKWKFRLSQRNVSSACWVNQMSGAWEGVIYLRQSTKLFWYHFEMIRLRLAWDLGRRRRLSRKARFQMKTSNRHLKLSVFHRASRMRSSRLFWYSGFPHTVYSAKARGARMGGGKADPRSWCYMAYEGTPLLSVGSTRPVSLRYVLESVRESLPGLACVYCWYNDVGVGGHPGLSLWY